MAALSRPQTDDVIIRREPRGTFTIGMNGGSPQISCETVEEALQRAGRFAINQHVQVWYTAVDRPCTPLADVRQVRKIWNEYVEMPGLRLTREQAQRLWSVDAVTCASLLESLVDLTFLVRGPDGKYARLAQRAEAIPPLRMAKADADAKPTAQALRHAG